MWVRAEWSGDGVADIPTGGGFVEYFLWHVAIDLAVSILDDDICAASSYGDVDDMALSL